MVLWGKKGTVEELYNPIEVWKNWADNVSGEALECGHFLPEEKPKETYQYIIDFFD